MQARENLDNRASATQDARMTEDPPARSSSADRFIHRAAAIVNAALITNAERNERSLAAARLVIAMAFFVRHVVFNGASMMAGNFKDSIVCALIVFIAVMSALHLWRPVGLVSFRTRQTFFVALDVLGFWTAVGPTVLWPEAGYQGFLFRPYAGLEPICCIAGGLRLRRSLALFASMALTVIIAVCMGIDLSQNAHQTAWTMNHATYYLTQHFCASLISVVIATRTYDLAKDAASAAIDAARAVEHFGAYVGREVAEEVLRGDEIKLGGVRQPVAVLFSDLRGFTRYAEKLSPEDLVVQLNAYLEEMVAVISAHGGVVDKYMGDGIMAVFGAPKTRPDDAERSLKAAKALVTALARHNARRAMQSLPALQMGIGVHYGEAVAGNIGTVTHA